MKADQFTKYEKARVLGARALQISMNAPLLIKISQEDLEKIKFDALKIAEVEFNSEALPISIHKPLPQKKFEKLKRAKEVKISEEEKEEFEKEEEEEITKEGEIMSLTNLEEEQDILEEDIDSSKEELE